MLLQVSKRENKSWKKLTLPSYQYLKHLITSIQKEQATREQYPLSDGSFKQNISTGTIKPRLNMSKQLAML